MNYCGDTDEDVVANETLTRLFAEDPQNSTYECILAADYFRYGWEAAVAFMKNKENIE